MQKNVNNYQRFWLVDPRILTPEAVLDYAKSLVEGSTLEVTNVAVTFNGSPIAVQLTGTPDQVRPEYDSLSDQRFVSCNIKGNMPGGANLTLNLNLGAGHLNAQLQNGKADLADALFIDLEEKFPQWFGLSDDEMRQRLAELSQLISEARKAAKASAKAKKDAAAVASARGDVDNLKKSVTGFRDNASKAAEEVSSRLQEATKSLRDITNAKAQSQSDFEAVKSMRDQVGGMEEQIKSFFGDITKNKSTLENTIADARVAVAENSTKTDNLITENETLQQKVREHLLKAVGASLFSSFEKRKKRIEISKWVWAGLTAVAVVAQVGIFAWLAQTAATADNATNSILTPRFILRATASIPIIFFIGYAIHQYAKEREFEELYGFKSALSFSLSPYIDLVRDLQSRGVDDRHIEFVIATINQVFSDPSIGRSVSARDGRNAPGLVKDLLDRVIKILEEGGRVTKQ